ncbi:unnamed protein product [Closterium sp. NIES-64]|nr:unnamed protein product [Closterium sp. NIES-64]
MTMPMRRSAIPFCCGESGSVKVWRIPPCTTVVSQKARRELSASVRVQTQNRKVRAEALPELETSLADPVDQHLSDRTLAAQGEDCGVTRVVLNHQQEVALVTLPTDGGWAPLIHVKRLQGSLCRGEVQGAAKAALGGVGTPTLLTRAVAGTKNVGAGTTTPTPLTPSVPLTKLLRRRDVPRALLLLPLRALATTTAATLLGTTPTSSTSSTTTASSAASTSAASTSAAASTTTAGTTTTVSAAAATTTTTPATSPAATPTPSAATAATATAPSSSTRALAPLALAGATSTTRGRRRADRLKTKQVGSSSRGNRGQQGGRRAPLKDGGARVTTRSTYSDYALLRCEEGLLEEVDGEGGGTDCEKVVPDDAKGVREARDYVQDVQQHRGWPTESGQWDQHQQQEHERRQR